MLQCRSLGLALGLALILAACGGSHDGAAPGPDASTVDAGGSDDPITVPADVWTWIPIGGTQCVHGSETGIAVNPHPGATKLVVFLQGGGSCTHCWGATESAKVGTPTHYDAASLAAEADIGNAGGKGQLLMRRNDADNPLNDANLVFVPYCTGDAHAGTATVTETGDDGLVHTDMFWGGLDLDLILRRLVVTYPAPSRVWLAGSSAGGFATTFNYAKVKAAFGVRTDTINDSGEPLVPSAPLAVSQTGMASLWGIATPAGCTTCTTALGFYQYNRALDPAARFAVLSNDYDPVIAENDFGTAQQDAAYLADFHAALHSFIDGLDSNAHALILGNTPASASHVVMNKQPYSGQVGAWLQLMVDDSTAWTDVTVAEP